MKGVAYTTKELETIHDSFVKGDPLSAIAGSVGKSAYAVLGRINQLSLEDPDRWDPARLKRYRSEYYQANKQVLKERCNRSRMKKRIRQSMRDVGYEMGSITKGNDLVAIKIMNDAVPPNRIYMADLRRDFGTHAREALGFEEFRDLPEELDLGIDGNAVIVSFNLNGGDEKMRRELDSFFDVYCYILKHEKQEALELRRQSKIGYARVG